MSDNATRADANASPTVQLFQRAHQKMVVLQRVEDQIQQYMNQRRSIQDELRGIQVQINEEFDRLLRATGQQPSRLLAEFADDLGTAATRNGATAGRREETQVEVND